MSKQPWDIVAYQWVVNAKHPNIGKGLIVGQTGPVFGGLPYPNDRWGLDQIWYLRNGQKVIARRKSNK